MTTWPQLYDPFDNRLLSTAVAALPVLTLFFVLVVLKKRVWVSALSGLLVAVALALLVFGMPAVLVATAAGHGFIFGVMRIAWIVVASIFLYNVASTTGQFQVMKDSIAGLSSDKRLQLVLIAFCFGAFLEGTGGGGAPVAIAGAFLIGLGFNPFQAATLCLIANTAPVAWGGVGNPIRVLAGVTGLPEAEFSAMAGRILPPLSLILPFWLVRSMVGWRETWQVWPALLVSGASFAAHAVLLVELSGHRAGGHRRRHLLAAGDGGVPESLAAGGGDSGQRRPRRLDQTPFRRRGVERLVAVHRHVDPDLRDRPARHQPLSELRCAAHADAVPAQRGAEDAAGRADADARRRHRQPELHRHSRDGGLRRRRHRGVARRAATANDRAPVQGDGRADDAVAAGDQLHGGPGLRDALFRHGYGAWA